MSISHLIAYILIAGIVLFLGTIIYCAFIVDEREAKQMEDIMRDLGRKK